MYQFCDTEYVNIDTNLISTQILMASDCSGLIWSHDKMPAGVPSFNLINWKLYESGPGQECLCVWTIDVLIWHSNYMLNDDTDSSGFPMG